MQSFVATGPQAASAIHGKAMGGELPIVGATVTLWQSQNNGYGGDAAQLGVSTTTDATGSFILPGNPVSGCTSGQLVYVVAAGGNGGGGANNSSILETSVVGLCGATNTYTWINEITTVATAYALGNFAKVSGTGNDALIHISVPANNNTVTGNNVTTGTSTTASGLKHAYLNAINIASTTSGRANTATDVGNGSVPQALINTIANVLQYCVNSNGSIASNMPCGKLFALTPAPDGTLPTNTFQAAVNLAKNPYVSADNVQSIFSLLPSQLAFQPVLATAPHDWTLALSYQTPPVVNTTTGTPFMASLDADDNVYIATTPTDPIATVQTQACIVSFSSSGMLRSGAGWGCNAIENESAYTWIAPDALGNLWVNNYTSTFAPVTGASMLQFNASNGGQIGAPVTFGSTIRPSGVAVNKQNDVYILLNSNSTGIATFLYFQNNGDGTWSRITNGTPHFSASGHALAIDANMNAWIAEFGSATAASGGAVGFFPFTTGFASSTVAQTAIATGSISASPKNSLPIGIAIDGSGNAWVTNDNVGALSNPEVLLTELTSDGTDAATITTTVASSGLNRPQMPEVDGDSTLWVPDTAGIHAYSTTAGVFLSQTANTTATTGGFEPCYLGYLGTGTSCQQSWSASTRNVAIDSTGSLWYLCPDNADNPTTAATGRLFQIIGTAAPTWPLLAQGQPGVRPQ